MSLQNIFEAGLAESIMPMNGMMRDWAATTVKGKHLEQDKQEADNIAYFTKLLDKEMAKKKGKRNQAAIDGYERLIARYQ